MPKGTCSVATCELPIRCSELCTSHYKQLLWRRKAAAKPTVVSTCPHCGELYEQTRGRRTRAYCTNLCKSRFESAERKAARQAARSFTECQWCGADIKHMRADAKVCSDFCANRCDYRDNRERIDIAVRRYVENNPEKVLAAGRRYRDENRERIYARQKRWQDENLEHHKNYQRAYHKRYALDNAEKRQLNTANRYARKRNNGGGALKISERDWSRMLLIYQHRCAYCGGGAGETLELEHVIPLARGGRHSIGNVVPACRRCNATKNDRLLVEWRNNIPRRVRRRVVAA